jgi:PKD repeat protein
MALLAAAAAQAQTGPTLAWDEDSLAYVTGYKVIVDGGAPVDYGLTPLAADGSCGCTLTPAPFVLGSRHTVVVSAYNPFGETPSANIVIGPTANAGGPYSGQVGTALTVTGAASTDQTGTISSYSWNWGDGSSSSTTSASATASHIYNAAGLFTVTLTVTDGDGAASVATTTATVVAPTITLSATTIAPGASLTATIANGPGNSLDWVGLFSTSTPDSTAYINFKYLNGLTSGTVTFTMPTTPGSYDLRLFRNNTLTRLATSATITVLSPSITAGATAVSPGATVTATIANGPGNSLDWVGLFSTSTPDSTAYINFKYLNGLTSGTVTFTMPTTPGTYNLRFFQNNTLTRLAASATITVLSPSITANVTTVSPGATVTATIANGPGNSLDWVGLFSTSTPDSTAYINFKYLNGLTSGTVTFTMPATAGTYNLRFFLNNTLTRLAASATITVLTPSITPNVTTVSPGATVTATIANGPGNSQDWVGLFSTSTPDSTAYINFKYLNGLTSGTVTFTMPTTPGTYNLRFFQNNTLTRLATTGMITVTP